jgi:hypothetical protein
VVPELLDQQLDSVQVGGQQLAVDVDGPLELAEGLLEPSVVPEDLAPATVSLGAVRIGAQGLVEPGQRLLDATSGRGLMGLIQTVPITVPIEHQSSRQPGRILANPRLPRPREPPTGEICNYLKFIKILYVQETSFARR